MTDARHHIAPALLAFLCVGALMFWFHDQFWWPVDEGVYAYVAQRALAGDVLHRDLIDLHAGYGNLLNISAFQLFGESLLSLRYPLVALTVLQCAIAYVLLMPKGAVVAVAGTLSVAAFSFILFPNPSANWHALATFFLMCLMLEKSAPGSTIRLFLMGAILGLCFFTRQLNGVFLALGLICVLLAEARDADHGGRGPALLFGGIASLGLLAYVASKQQIFGLLWGGIWPLALLVLVTLRARMTWGTAARICGLVIAGFAVAGLPLAAIALYQGSFAFWVSDIFWTALLINGQDFITQQSLLNVIMLGWENITMGAGVARAFSGAAWIAIVASVPLLGAMAVLHFFRTQSLQAPVILAVFWAVNALHYQIPIYLFFTLPAVFFALIVMRPANGMAAALIVLSGYAVLFQAGQPLERGLTGTVAGIRAPANELTTLPRVGLRIQPADAAIYHDVINAIEQTAGPDEPLMTLPMDPELNFMTARKAPVRYYSAPLGLLTLDDVNQTVETLEDAAPLFVVHRRQDKYSTDLSALLLEQVQDRSDPPLSVGPFDLYRFRAK